jgi:hypothetical protein
VRVLLDEQLPRHLARELDEHEVRTVQSQGWAGVKNGELLRLAAEAGFDVLLTADQNFEYQQNLADSPLAVVVLVASATRWKTCALAFQPRTWPSAPQLPAR